MAVQQGAQRGPYRVDDRLWAGGMGEVYAATDTRLKRRVAIKVLPASLETDAQYRARFQREAHHQRVAGATTASIGALRPGSATRPVPSA